MARLEFVTLFPELILGALRHSIVQRAEAAGWVSFGVANPRDFATDKHKTVDDQPFGGGPGMLMQAPVVSAAIDSLQPDDNTSIVFPDPVGKLFRQGDALELAAKERLIFVCGHYEGIDDRVAQHYNALRYSLGDFVVTGGELPALVMADAIVRLLPGVLGDAESLEIDSFTDGLLSAPQYTRPETWQGRTVQEVLKSGDHGAIARWKRRHALRVTRELRPDLFCSAPLDKKDLDLLES